MSRWGAGTGGALDAGKETCGVVSGRRLIRRPWQLSFVTLVMTGALASGFALALGQLSFVLFEASKALGSGKLWRLRVLHQHLESKDHG